MSLKSSFCIDMFYFADIAIFARAFLVIATIRIYEDRTFLIDLREVKTSDSVN